jgi:hypothetical protein
MQRNSEYVDKLEEKIQRLEQRELLWIKLAENYTYIVSKFQRGLTVNRQNWDDLQDAKNQLGIGNGLLK